MFKLIKKTKVNRGMTYVELIVVISIFAIMSSIAIFNYRGFQSRIDIKNLSSDIALKIVQAQKNSSSGLLPPISKIPIANWKPSYGIYFYTASSDGANSLDGKRNFVYFVDLDNSLSYSDVANIVLSSSCNAECLNDIAITNNNSISDISVFYQNDPSDIGGLVAHAVPNGQISIFFTRPNSGAVIKAPNPFPYNVSYVRITITSFTGATSFIKLYSSGRVQID